MDGEKEFDVALLEEVFNEVDVSESGRSSTTKSKESEILPKEYLEGLTDFEKELLSKACSSSREKKCLQETNSSENPQEISSIVHEGLTDSSDDEDNKYFEESKYNECGKKIKNLLKEKVNIKLPSVEDRRPSGSLNKSEPEKKDSNLSLKELEKFTSCSNEKQILSDPILGMHIINPRFSSATLKEKLKGRISISTLKLKGFLETPESKTCDWATGGVIISKLTRTSKNGNQYCVWHLTDLKGDIKTVSVFLFGSAYKEYWKTSLGSVVAILNPIVMENNEKSEATLRVDNALKILSLGTSKDYGLCKSKKKNGENCSSVVNKSKCDFCVYHMKKEYDRACRRTDLQPPKIGRKLDSFRAKVLGNTRVSQTGKPFPRVTGSKSAKQVEKDKQRLDLLDQKAPVPSEGMLQQRGGALGILNKSPLPVLTRETFRTPKPESQMIDLGFTISKKERMAAKANALKYIREHGPLKRFSEKTKRTPEQIASVKRKLKAEAEDEKEEKRAKTSNDSQTDSLKQKYLKYGITEEFLKVMNSESRNPELLKMAETNEREKYFEKLETREKIEEKMASTFKVECKAVRCLKCNYKSFSASDLCKKERHPLKVVTAFKRFWKCGNCTGRTVSLELFPLHSCKVCGSSKWERASMMPERKDSNLVIEKLSLRGDEEKFVGSASKQANLNLLVPEEAS